MTHIFQAVGGFICGGISGPRGAVCTAPGGNIYLCGQAQGSSEWRRGHACPGGAGGNTWECTLPLPTTPGCHTQRRGAEEEEGTRRQFCTREFRERVPHKSRGSGIAVPSANPGAAQHPPAKSSALPEPLLPSVGNGRNEKTSPKEVQGLRARFHANTCTMPGTR